MSNEWLAVGLVSVLVVVFLKWRDRGTHQRRARTFLDVLLAGGGYAGTNEEDGP